MSPRKFELSLGRIMLRALGLMIVIPFLVVLYLFRDHLEGKGLTLFFLGALSLCGFYLVWMVFRSIGSLQTGLVRISQGDSESIQLKPEPSQLREMAEIVDTLNQLTIDFRENAAQLENFIKQFTTLAEISEITARVPDIQELLKLVLSRAASTTHAKRGTIMLLEEEGSHMEVVAVEGWVSDQQNELIPLESTIAGNVIKSGKPLLVEHIGKAVDLNSRNNSSIYSSPSFLIMPINTKRGTIGSVCLSEKSTGGPFNSRDQQFLTALLGQVGYAIENARLLKQARESAHQLKQTVLEQKKEISDAHRQIMQFEKLTALGQLAGGIAHDFNNLLQAITGYCELAQRGLSPDDKRFMVIEQAFKASERAADLTGQLLAFGRRQTLQPRYIDLSKVVDDMMDMLQRLLGEQVEVKTYFEDGLRTVHADPRQIEQVLMNLCINARDAMADGGTITIETHNVVIDKTYCVNHPWTQPGLHVLLSVTDTGCGMDEKTKSQAFEPFFTTKEAGKGTGLGLSTVYGIVRQHSGLIDVSSEPEGGTTFTVYLPEANSVPVVEEKPYPFESAIRGKETILVAEDNDFVREWIKQILSESGYRVIAACDGQEAVDLFEENSNDIEMILLDAVMPKMNGVEVCSEIKSQNPDVGVLFCSGYSADVIPPDFLTQHGLELLLKPFEPIDLLRKVRESLDTSAVAVG